MTSEAVQRLAKNTVRLRRESVSLCSNCEGMIVLTRQLRLEHRALLQAIA